MKILLTGASSFTGFWFAKELTQQGNKVFATFTKSSIDKYSGIRKIRVSELLNEIVPFWNFKFGDEQFIQLLKEEKFDVICHHAAYVDNYKDDHFDYITALKNNTFNILKVLEALTILNKGKIIISGSVFESDEGIGSNKTFSPYGLSKKFTSDVFKYFCGKHRIPLGKFIIPNPFGPYEEERFTHYLIKSWVNEEIPIIRTPLYVRDNIHISLLAKCYAKFCKEFYKSSEMFLKISLSGYIESQGAFAKRFSNEMSKRLNLRGELRLFEHKEFNEPLIKINTEPANLYIKDWQEEEAWNELAQYYKKIFEIR